jgi:hypothetical protein
MLKESQKIPRRPLSLNKLEHTLGTQGVSCTLGYLFLIHYRNNICVEIIHLFPGFSPAKTTENCSMDGLHTLINIGNFSYVEWYYCLLAI